MASRGASPFVPPLPLVIPGGMNSTDFVGARGRGRAVGHGYSNSSLNHSTTAPTLGHGHSNSSVNHSASVDHASSANHAQSFVTTTTTSALPLARVRTHSVSTATGAGHGYGYGYPRTDDGHSVFADSPFESESPLHWQDEPARAEAESRLRMVPVTTGMGR
ncbi:hypothetical protein B0H13DRAFT_797972 [Mycena leptocephala]|nr:hypothetical protein B0H13DRAFT_797972 [Mycena leptocephala]